MQAFSFCLFFQMFTYWLKLDGKRFVVLREILSRLFDKIMTHKQFKYNLLKLMLK